MQSNQIIFSGITPIELQNLIEKSVKDAMSKVVMNENKADDLLSRIQAAELLGISLPTLLDWTKTGKITGYRIASRVKYKRNEIVNSLSKIKTK
jgi:excisionase family DNA binding protein